MNDVTKTPDELERSRMTFGQHLTELRMRLVKALLATAVTVAVATIWADDLVRFLVAPFQNVMRSINGNPVLFSNSPTGPLIRYFTVSMGVGLIAAAPVWLYQIWAFIAAGLYTRERRWVLRFAPLSLLLFAAGIAFGYLVLLPVALKWLLTFPSPDLIQSWITIDAYLSLFLTLTLLLGASFQLPVIMLGLAKAGMMNAESFRKKRKIVILLIFIVAGILTPPDPITQPLVAVPLCFLFELGIFLAWLGEGEKRMPIDWKKWRKRAVWISVIGAVIWVFRGKIANLWGGVQANDRVQTRDSRLPWTVTGARFLGGPPEAALRVNDDQASPELVVAGAGRVALVRFTRADETAVVVEAETRSARVMSVPAGAAMWRCDLVEGKNEGEVFDTVIRALRLGDSDTRKTARVLLRTAMGKDLPEDDSEAARLAEEWLAPRRDQPFQPKSR